MQSNFIEIALQHGRSPVNLLHNFRTPFPKNTSGGRAASVCNCWSKTELSIYYLFILRFEITVSFAYKKWRTGLSLKSFILSFMKSSLTVILYLIRSSQRMCSVRKGVLRNFAKFTGKHLCQSLFFNKIAGLGSI